ncbi:hypothetical protein Bca4012_009752 [Brassica carinata]
MCLFHLYALYNFKSLRSEGMRCSSVSNLMVSPCFKPGLYIFYYYRDVDYRENRRYDERSDYAGGLQARSSIEFKERDERNKFLGYKNVLEEQCLGKGILVASLLAIRETKRM